MKLKIEDYSKDPVLQPVIRSYNDLIIEYIAKNTFPFFLHSRKYFWRTFMEIIEKVKQVLTEEEEERTANPRFQELRAFYEAMKKEGIAINQGYKLPPIDTVGRRLYDETTSRAGQKK